MRQNIASLVIDAETLKAIDGTLATLEKLLEDFIELSAEQRRELLKLGPKSEVFCRETLSVMERSPGALPGDFDMDAVLAAAARHGKAIELNANPHRLDRKSVV